MAAMRFASVRLDRVLYIYADNPGARRPMPEPSPSHTPAPAPGLDLDDFLCFALHSAAQAAVRANKPALDELGLTYPQFLAMAALWAADDQTVGGLGAKLFLDSSTLTPLLKRPEAAGLVERARCAEDERKSTRLNSSHANISY